MVSYASATALGLLAAALAFVVSAGVLALALPFFFMLIEKCFSFYDSCADGAGWAILISAPITIPLIAIAAAGCALATYLRLTRTHQTSFRLMPPDKAPKLGDDETATAELERQMLRLVGVEVSDVDLGEIEHSFSTSSPTGKTKVGLWIFVLVLLIATVAALIYARRFWP